MCKASSRYWTVKMSWLRFHCRRLIIILLWVLEGVGVFTYISSNKHICHCQNNKLYSVVVWLLTTDGCIAIFAGMEWRHSRCYQTTLSCCYHIYLLSYRLPIVDPRMWFGIIEWSMGDSPTRWSDPPSVLFTCKQYSCMHGVAIATRQPVVTGTTL